MRRRYVALLTLALAGTIAVVLAVATPLSDSPERHVARYLGATSAGDLKGALGEWALYNDGRNHPSSDPLTTRRRDLTAELVVDRAGGSPTITSIEWWRTCCEPGRVPDRRAAGLARVHVTTTGQSGKTYRLLFEVWVKDLTWWGDAKGEWLHDWRLYEVHAEDQPCLFPNPASGCIRSFD